VFSQIGIVFSDARHRMPQRLRHARSGSLGSGTGSPVASTESDGTGQLSEEELTFSRRSRDTRVVCERSRLLEVFVDVREPASIRLLRLRVEHLAGVA
jgi:hypothetical protein